MQKTIASTLDHVDLYHVDQASATASDNERNRQRRSDLPSIPSYKTYPVLDRDHICIPRLAVSSMAAHSKDMEGSPNISHIYSSVRLFPALSHQVSLSLTLQD